MEYGRQPTLQDFIIDFSRLLCYIQQAFEIIQFLVPVEKLPMTRSGKVIARAMLEFGMICVEDSCKTCTGVYLERLDHRKEGWRDLELGTLNAIRLDRFRVVKPLMPSFKNRPSRDGRRNETCGTLKAPQSRDKAIDRPFVADWLGYGTIRDAERALRKYMRATR